MSVGFAIAVARRYAQANMTASVRVRRMGALFLRADGDAEAVETDILYEGPARIYDVTGPLTMGYGEAPSYHSTTYCSIPVEEDGGEAPQINDMVEVITHADPLVVDRVFRVTHVDSGGHLPVVRRLTLQGVDKHVRAADPSIPADWLVD